MISLRRTKLIDKIRKKITSEDTLRERTIEKITSVKTLREKTLGRITSRKKLRDWRPSLGSAKGSITDAEAVTITRYALGPSRIVSVELTSEAKRIFNLLPPSMRTEFLQIIQLGMRILYNSVVYYASKIINRLVPKDTGTLRSDMLDSIINTKMPPYSNIKLTNIDIQLSSKLEYSQYVNEMPQSSLRHFGEKRSWRTGQPLYDPYAVHHFFEKVRRALKREIKNVYIKGFYNSLRATFPDPEDLFKVKYR